MGECIKMRWLLYTMACYSATRKKGILPLATTWMDFEGILLSEISQAEKGKYWTV